MTRKKTSKYRREQRKRSKMREVSIENARKCGKTDLFEKLFTNSLANKSIPTATITGCNESIVYLDMNLLGNMPISTQECSSALKEEKENNMSDNLAVQRRYLENRLYSTWINKIHAAEKKFGLTDEMPPKDPFELVKRIQDGQFVLPVKDEGQEWYGNPTHYIRWRDPAKVEDKEGFKAFRVLLDKQNTLVKDAIFVKEPSEALEALQAWEAETV